MAGTDNTIDFEKMTDEEINSLDPEIFANAFYGAVSKEGAVMTFEEMDSIEEFLRQDKVSRRLSLVMLTKSFKHLEDQVIKDKDFALAVADTLDCLNIEVYEQIVNLLNKAKGRLIALIASRADCAELLDKVKSEHQELTVNDKSIQPC